MALFATQLQPWEEHQSPSPTEEIDNPYELALARSRSSSNGHKSETKPVSPVNTLHRQLSGDPDAPPPAWKRRPSVNSNHNSINRTPSNGPPSASKRHPNLQMTLSGTQQPLPDAGPLNESPNASGTDLAELGLPQPAFIRRANGMSGRSSNRSSTHSLSGLTSEELWQMDQPDLSNPMRASAETPLITARRNSRIGRTPSAQGYISPEVIWPSATPQEQSPVLKSKSTTSVASIGKKRITIRKKSSRNQVVDTTGDGVYLHGTTVSPNSLSRPDSMILSSAQSSTTSLNSQGFSPVKVTPTAAMNRPPSTYYSRDFLSSLAPREGGYAIAATMGNGLGAHGAMSVDERRRSQYDPSIRRAPVSKSAGMGRWSLDGGEHYGVRPYGTPSAATTASNLSGPPITSPETSPPAEELRLPDGASPALSPTNSAQQAPPQAERDSTSPTAGPTISIPVNPSPLSQQTHANDVATPRSEKGPAIPAPVNATQSAPALTNVKSSTASTPLATKKSKKDLAKEAKADAQRQKIEAQKAEYKRKAEAKAAALKAKSDKKEAEAKAKQDAKRKEKEEKEKRKAEKAAKKTGRSGSFASLPTGGSKDKKETVPPVPAIPASHARSTSGPAPLPRTNSSPSAAPKATAQARQTAVSMPLDKSIAEPAPRGAPAPTPVLKEQKSRMSLFGTLKKRFSSGPSSSQADVRLRQTSDAANLDSMPKPPVAAAAAAPSPNVTAPAAVAVSPRSHVNVPSPPPGGADAIPIQTQTQSPTVVIPSNSSSSQHATPTRAVSRDQGSIKSGRSNSVRGPRRMPGPIGNTSPDRHAASQSRPTSLITTPSTETAPITPAAGFPFRNSQVNPEIVTPSTFTEMTETESSMFSHTAPGQSETSSPFTSVGSRKSSLTGDDKVAPTPVPVGMEAEGPERGNSATSKSSEETLQARPAPPAPMVM